MKNTKCQKCGCEEFVTKPIWYEVYNVIDGKLVIKNKEMVCKKVNISCRNCSEKLLISIA